MTVSVDVLDSDDGIRIDDTIDRRRLELYTPGPVTPTEVSPDRLSSPVDTAVSIRAESLTLPEAVTTYVRDGEGVVVANIEQFAEQSLPHGDYQVELSAAIKLYVGVEGPVTVDADGIELTISTDQEREFVVGARSYHERPAATITTTSDPHDVMEAMSYLGSALQTTDPDRSYPTLRGHPPEIQLGDELAVPDRLSRPNTGVTIEVPADLRSVFVVAPLAYYLGADIAPGTAPRIVTEEGYTHALDGPEGFEAEVERVLKQTFFFDCLTRPANEEEPLQERVVAAERTDFDFDAVGDRPSGERLAAYLSVPYETIRDCIPRWKLTAHVAPRADSIEIIPFLVNDLAVINTPASVEGVTQPSAQSEAIEEFMRDGLLDEPVRRGVRNTSNQPPVPSFVEPEETDSLEQAWVGEDVPVGASKATVEAFRNRLDRDASDGDVDIVVVCNDREMLEEGHFAQATYDSREELPLDVQVYTDLTTDRLRFVLESDIDFLHYVGHIDDDGFECADGRLDVRTLEDVGVDAFFLNACRSYDQGMELIQRGAIGGVVTLDNVIDSGAVRVGRAMARLLNRGFPLRAALNIASERSIVGGQYIVVGDGNFDIAHAEGLVPDIVDVTTGDPLSIDIQTYPVGNIGLGAVHYPRLRGDTDRYLIGSPLTHFDVTAAELRDWLAVEVTPLRIDGELRWSDKVDFDALTQGPG